MVVKAYQNLLRHFKGEKREVIERAISHLDQCQRIIDEGSVSENKEKFNFIYQALGRETTDREELRKIVGDIWEYMPVKLGKDIRAEYLIGMPITKEYSVILDRGIDIANFKPQDFHELFKTLTNEWDRVYLVFDSKDVKRNLKLEQEHINELSKSMPQFFKNIGVSSLYLIAQKEVDSFESAFNIFRKHVENTAFSTRNDRMFLTRGRGGAVLQHVKSIETIHIGNKTFPLRYTFMLTDFNRLFELLENNPDYAMSYLKDIQEKLLHIRTNGMENYNGPFAMVMSLYRTGVNIGEPEEGYSYWQYTVKNLPSLLYQIKERIEKEFPHPLEFLSKVKEENQASIWQNINP